MGGVSQDIRDCLCGISRRGMRDTMTDKELKKLSRNDLLEMLLQQSTELQQTRRQLEEAQAALAKRKIILDQAGSIADASLQLNGVFEAAQKACEQYMENIQTLSQRQEEVCAKREEESRVKAEALINAARKQQAAMVRDTQTKCDEMIAKAETDAQAYWDQVYGKLQAFVAEHAELERMLAIMKPRTS